MDGAAIDINRLRCRGCAQRVRCLPGGLAPAQVQAFEAGVQRRRPLAPGEHMVRAGDPFRFIGAVQSGCLKSYAIDREGREHVVAFHFPGEIIGVDAIHPQRHTVSCVALADSQVCCLPYPVLGRMSREIPQLQEQLLRILSRDMLGAATIAGDFSASERLAGFLVMVAARVHRGPPVPMALDLAMSRQDIANFLRLAPETVSRVLARFQKDGLLTADRRRITLRDPAGLGRVAACMNPYDRCGDPAPPRAAAS